MSQNCGFHDLHFALVYTGDFCDLGRFVFDPTRNFPQQSDLMQSQQRIPFCNREGGFCQQICHLLIRPNIFQVNPGIKFYPLD